MPYIDDQELAKLAELSHIQYTSEEAFALKERLTRTLAYVELLQEVNTDNVEPCSHILEMHSKMREDKVVEEELLSREAFLSNAPSQIGGMVRVPLVIKF